MKKATVETWHRHVSLPPDAKDASQMQATNYNVQSFLKRTLLPKKTETWQCHVSTSGFFTPARSSQERLQSSGCQNDSHGKDRPSHSRTCGCLRSNPIAAVLPTDS